MENQRLPDPKLIRDNIFDARVDLIGHFTPFVKGNPIVVELPGVHGYYVPVFTKKEDMESAMRHLQIFRYETVLVGSTKKFYDLCRSAGTQVVVNPKSYNGVTVWEQLLPNEARVILPGEGT